MSDTLTEEQSEFNDYIVLIENYKRFKAYEFEKDIKLKRLLDRYLFRLKDEEFSFEVHSKEYFSTNR